MPVCHAQAPVSGDRYRALPKSLQPEARDEDHRQEGLGDFLSPCFSIPSWRLWALGSPRIVREPSARLRVGRVRRIVTQCSFKAPDEFLEENIRASSALELMDCMGDLGWYDIRFASWAMGWQLPERVSGRLLAEAKRPDSPWTVPTEFSGELLFAGGVSAKLLLLVPHREPAAGSGRLPGVGPAGWTPRGSVTRRPTSGRGRGRGCARRRRAEPPPGLTLRGRTGLLPRH